MNYVDHIYYLTKPPVAQIAMDFRAMDNEQFQIVAEQVNQLNGGLLRMIVSHEQDYRAENKGKDDE